MEQFEVRTSSARRAAGTCRQAVVGVNTSGNIEVLVERVLPETESVVAVTTAVTGYRDLWQAVIEDFFDRAATGGLRFDINDGGAKPDVVSLRLRQGVRRMEIDA